MTTKQLLLIVTMLLTLTATAQPGALDLSFNPGTGADSTIRTIAVQPDGKILIGGDFLSVNGVPAQHIARLHADGTVDTGFCLNTNNVVYRDYPNRLYKILIQPDNKILVIGDFGFFTSNGDSTQYLYRLHPDGKPDTSFRKNLFNGGLQTAALQPDGKIIIGGNHVSINGLPYAHLTRLYTNGDIDTTFDTRFGLGGSVETIAIQSDGKVMLGGSFTSFFGVQGFRIARANPDGSVDTTFNPGIGGAGSNVQVIQLLPDGRMMIGGQFGFYNGTTVGYMVRARTNGSIDFTFRNNPGANLPVYAIHMLPDSGFFAGGSFTAYYGVPANRIAKITADGNIDTVFNTGSGASAEVLAITQQSDDKVLVGGRFKTFDGVSRSRIARLYNCLTPKPDSILGLTYAECRGTAQTYSVKPVAGATKYEWTLPVGWTGSSDSTTITAISDGSGGIISVRAFSPGCGFSYATKLSVATLPIPAPSICLVTVDSASTHNIVVWEKQPTNLIDSFCIYRETSSNVFTKIAAVPYDSLSVYHDYDANPNITSYRYKLSTVDTCGVESALSAYHSTIHLQNLANGNFQWTFYRIEGQPNPVVAFNFYRDAQNNGNFFPIGNIPGTNATFSDLTYTSFPDANYVVDAEWSIVCVPSRAAINTTRSNIKKDKVMINVGLTEAQAENPLLVFPNPAEQVLFVQHANGAQPAHISLTNAVGQTVWQGTATAIDVAAFPKGIYLLKAETRGVTAVKRVAIK